MQDPNTSRLWSLEKKGVSGVSEDSHSQPEHLVSDSRFDLTFNESQKEAFFQRQVSSL